MIIPSQDSVLLHAQNKTNKQQKRSALNGACKYHLRIYIFICIYITVFKKDEVINLRKYGEKQQKFEEEEEEK